MERDKAMELFGFEKIISNFFIVDAFKKVNFVKIKDIYYIKFQVRSIKYKDGEIFKKDNYMGNALLNSNLKIKIIIN